jgi:hypothetical protein
MKMLTLWQPWASFVALEIKHYETRSWATNYRGPLVIHASKRPLDLTSRKLWEDVTNINPDEFSFLLGHAFVLLDLTDCQLMVESDRDVISPSQISIERINFLGWQETKVGIWEAGRYAWKLENVRLIKPAIACCGFQGLRDAPNEVLRIANPESQSAIACFPLQLSLF